MSASVYSREYQLFLGVLREVREASGLTQRDVATRMNMSQSFVAKVEGGHNRMDVAQVVLFCQAVGIPFMDFMGKYETALQAKG